MRRGFVFALAALASSAFALQQPPPKPAAAPPAGPRIAVEPASFDFGSALPQKTLTKEFSLKNLGSAELVIESVSTTCGCTVGQLETRTLKPGVSVPLKVSLETRSYSGALQRAVLIRSNDPTRGLLEVKVQANIQAAPAAKPQP